MINVQAWLREFRVRFLFFVSLPVFLGTVIAYLYYPASFDLVYFLLAILAMLLLHSGTIIVNDYFDFQSGTDVLNRTRTPYSGGSGLLPEKKLRPGQVLLTGACCFGICIAIGMFIVLTRSLAVLLVGIAGVVLGVAYTTPPFKLSYRGLGELARLAATPLIVLGAFLVQVPVTTLAVPGLSRAVLACLAASAPVAFLNMAALYIFEFPDYEADRQVGKRNLVVRLGLENAPYLYMAMQALAYVTLLAGIVAGILPRTAAAALLLLPVSAYSTAGLFRRRSDALALVPYMKASSWTYIIASLIIVLAYLVRL